MSGAEGSGATQYREAGIWTLGLLFQRLAEMGWQALRLPSTPCPG